MNGKAIGAIAGAIVGVSVQHFFGSLGVLGILAVGIPVLAYLKIRRRMRTWRN